MRNLSELYAKDIQYIQKTHGKVCSNDGPQMAWVFSLLPELIKMYKFKEDNDKESRLLLTYNQQTRDLVDHVVSSLTEPGYSDIFKQQVKKAVTFAIGDLSCKEETFIRLDFQTWGVYVHCWVYAARSKTPYNKGRIDLEAAVIMKQYLTPEEVEYGRTATWSL